MILRDQLTAVQQARAAQEQQITDELAAYEPERDNLLAQIEQLQQQLVAIEKTREVLQRQLEIELENATAKEFGIAQAALKASLAAVSHAHRQIIRYQEAIAERKALFAANPELAEKLLDYRRYEADPKAVLKTVSLWHQPALRRSYESIREQLAPVLTLDAELQALQRPQPVVLHVLVSHDPQTARMRWILPLPIHVEMLPSESATLLLDLFDLLSNVIRSLAQQPEWGLSTISVGQWAEFLALEAGGDYRAQISPSSLTEQTIAQAFQERQIVDGLQLTVQVAAILPAAWSQGMAVTPIVSLEADEPIQPAPVLEGGVEQPAAYLPLETITNGWYSDADIQSWERPLKVTKHSLWNVRGRRMRTMLMRMIASGHIGQDALSKELVHEGLPPLHAAEMRRDVDRLIAANFLLVTQNSMPDGHHVAVNPARLTEIQELINRDVTLESSWASILADEK